MVAGQALRRGPPDPVHQTGAAALAALPEAGAQGPAGVAPPSPEGALWVCATPIGNLHDASPRLLETLGRVDLVAAEDTRRTLQLLNHFGLRRPLVSFHEHNARRRTPELLAQLQAGRHIALVSDAGFPGVSDPGSELVAAALEAGVAVRVIPGPSAVLAALAVSGFPGQPFYFEGFLPRRPADRRRRLEQLRTMEATLVFFEAPHRVARAVADMAEVLGSDRPAACARELTKVHEEVIRASLGELAHRLAEGAPRGEFTVVVGPPARVE